MARLRSESERTAKRKAPARSMEARENQLIAYAVDLAEKQILAGTASSQVISHFLKLGSTKEKLEKEKLESENQLLRAKTEAIKSAERVEALYKDALDAMRRYRSEDGGDDEND